MITKTSNKLTTIEDIKNNAVTTTLNEENKSKVKNFGMENISMPQFPIPETETTDDLTDCDRYLEKIFGLKQSPTNAKQFFQIQGQQIKKTAQLVWQNMINQLVQLKDMIVNAWNAVKKMVKDVVDDIIDQYRIIIAYFKAEYAQILNMFKKLKKSTSKEDRKKKRERIKEEAKKYGGEVLEMLGIIELWNTLKDVWNALKNMWGVAKDGWNSMISNFKNLKSLLKDSETPIGKSIFAWIVALLPLVAQLALTVLGAISLTKDQQKLNEELAEEAIKQIEKPDDSNNYSSLLTNAIKTTQENIKQNKKEKEENITPINNNSNDSNNPAESIFSNQGKENEEEKKDVSCFSICPVEYDTNGVVDEEYIGYLIEIANNVNSFNFYVNVKDNIKNNDIIGNIEDIPIKARVEGTVKEKKETYIIVEPNEVDENFTMDFPTNDENIDSLISAFEDVNKIENVLNNDIFYLYKTILYNNYVGYKLTENSLSNKYSNIINTHEKNIEKLGEDIQKVTSKSNVEEKIKQDDGLLQIKDDVMRLKTNFFNSLISRYNSENKSIYASDSCDYELLDYYYEFILNFNYDKDNNYKINLFNMILGFINDRQEIEKFDKNNLLNNFNKLSLNITKDENFFKTIKNSKKEITKKYIDEYITNEEEKTKISYDELKKTKEYIDVVYNFIKEKCNIKLENKSFEIDTDRMSNDEEYRKQIEAQLNGDGSNSNTLSDEDKAMLKKDKIAKRLSILFYIYDSLEDKNFVKTNNTFDKLKKQTKIESTKIINYFNDIINKYKDANKNVDDKLKNIETQLKEIDWGIPSELYIDNKKYTHYILKSDKNKISNNSNNSANNNATNNNGGADNNNDNNSNNNVQTNNTNNSDDAALADAADQISTKTSNEANSYLYWLRYCGMASLMNCALPMYWGTGILIAGAPLMLPIILVPIYVLNGSCVCVFGLGICGIAIWPMMLYSNLSTNVMTYLAPVNIIVDLIKNTLQMTKEKSKMSIKPLLKGYIAPIDKEIKETEKQINDMKKEISLIKSM